MGWTLPSSTPDDYILRVHDTRLEPKWLRDLAAELAPIDTDTIIVGGDFVSSPDIEDIPAFKPAPLQRWGPPTGDGYHILVPPRPHVANWLQRCHHQLGVEAPLTRISVCCIVPRASCPSTLDAASIQRLVPQSAPLLNDPTVELRAIAVGERPPIVRIPVDEMTLPPRKWEIGNLPRHQVLLVLQFHRHGGSHSPLSAEWIRGQVPDPAPSELELLRLQLVLPPSVKKDTAVRLARKAIEKAAQAMKLPSPAPHQLRQLQIDKDALYALLGVPRHHAVQWMRASGCGGLYLRPFWTEQSGAAMARDKYNLLWVRNQLTMGPTLWDAVKHFDSVVGLLPGEKDIAIRLTADAPRRSRQQSLHRSSSPSMINMPSSAVQFADSGGGDSVP